MDDAAPHANKTRTRLAKARELLSGGWSTADIVWKLAEDYGISRGSARRSLNGALRVAAAASDLQRKAKLGKQLAKLERAQRAALEAVRPFAYQGNVIESIAAPDLQAFLEAVREENRLLGLHLPTPEQLTEGGACMGQLVVIQRTTGEGSASSTDPAIPNPGNDTSNGHAQAGALPSPFTRLNGHI